MRRAQIKMFETVAVLIVFFFLLITGSVFYFGLEQSSLDREKADAQQQYATQIALKSLYLPELDCSFLLSQRDNCIDLFKLFAFSSLFKKASENTQFQADYASTLGITTIVVSEVYPDRFSVMLRNETPEGNTAQEKSLNPILLYNATTDDYAFGILEVTTYV